MDKFDMKKAHCYIHKNFHKVRTPLDRIGAKHFKIAIYWLRTSATFSVATALYTFYFTDWRLICKNIPYYKDKFAEEDKVQITE